MWQSACHIFKGIERINASVHSCPMHKLKDKILKQYGDNVMVVRPSSWDAGFGLECYVRSERCVRITSEEAMLRTNSRKLVQI